MGECYANVNRLADLAYLRGARQSPLCDYHTTRSASSPSPLPCYLSSVLPDSYTRAQGARGVVSPGSPGPSGATEWGPKSG